MDHAPGYGPIIGEDTGNLVVHPGVGAREPVLRGCFTPAAYSYAKRAYTTPDLHLTQCEPCPSSGTELS